jgi:hypothetical protein
MSALVLERSVLVAGYALLGRAAQRSSAVSDEAESIRVAANEVLELEMRSFALFGRKGLAISEIAAVVEESRTIGDDECEPISPQAEFMAVAFVRALPENIPIPEFAWEPDGSISLDWIASRHRMLSLSVGDSSRLPYAWIDGGDKGHAVVSFDGATISPRILDDIRRITRGADASVWAA